MSRILRGTAALTALAVLLVGIPWLLLTFAGSPIPDQVPTLEELTGALTRRDDGQVLITVLTWAGWAGWAVFAVSTIAEIVDQASTRTIRVPGLSLPRAGVRPLVTAILAMGTIAAAPTGIAAATPDTAPTTSSSTAGAGALSTISPGQQLTIPQQTPPAGLAAHTTDTVSDRAGDDAFEEDLVVDVQAGDTLWGLAATHLGDPTRYPEIVEANPGLITDPDHIEVGWDLTIEDAEAAASPEAGTAGPGQDVTTAPTETEPAPPADTPAEAGPGAADAQAPATSSSGDETPGQGQDEQSPGRAAPQPITPAAPAQDPQQAPAASTPAPSPAPATVPASTSSSLLGVDVDEDTVRNLVGIGALSAAGAIALLAGRRTAQSRRRRPGRRIAMPTGGAADLETKLRTTGDPLAAADLDRALRTLASWAHHTSTPMPGVRAARITHDELELYLTEDTATLPDPFYAADSEPGTWVLDRDGLDTLLEGDDLASIPAPCPSLVTLGQDEAGGWVLVHLEEIGSLAIAADPSDATSVIAALTLELVGSSWADDLRLTLVGVLPELAGALSHDRVEHVPTLASVLPGVVYAGDVHTRTLTETGHDSVSTARAALVATETWTPHLLILGQDPTPTERDQLTELLQGRPRLAVATITQAPTPLTEWVLHLDGPATSRLDPAGVTLTPHLIPDHELADLLEAFSTTSLDDVDGPDWARTITTEPTAGTTGDLDEPVPAGHSDEPTLTLLHPRPPEETTHDDVDEHLDVPDMATGPNQDSSHDHDQAPVDDEHETEDQAPAATGSDEAQDIDVDDGQGEEVGPDLEAPVSLPGPTIRLLGPVRVDRAQGRRPQSPGRATELIAYLALHPSDTHHALDEAMWPGRRIDSTRRSGPVSQARAWLGTTTSGIPYVGLVDEHGYRLVDVTTDWDRFQALVGHDIATAATTDLTTALRLVDGQPLSGVNPRYYAWAETDRQEMIASVADVAHELSTRSLAAGDARTAAWAAAKGTMVEPASELLWRDQLRAAALSAVPGRVDQVAQQLTDTLEPISGDMDPETIDLLTQLLHTPHGHHAHG